MSIRPIRLVDTTILRVAVSDYVVQVGLYIVIGLVLRVHVEEINFITIAIFSLPGIPSVDVVHVSLLQVFASKTNTRFNYQ